MVFCVKATGLLFSLLIINSISYLVNRYFKFLQNKIAFYFFYTASLYNIIIFTIIILYMLYLPVKYIAQCYTVKIRVYNAIKLNPYRKRQTPVGTLTSVRVIFKA